MRIRPAVHNDIPVLVGIEQAAASHPWSEALFESCFSDRYFNQVILSDSEAVVGFYIAEYLAGEASLFDIAVHPLHQGQGLGRRLLQHFVQRGLELGAEQFFLEVRASNAPAIALYQSAGFIECGRRRNYYRSATACEDAIVMQRAASPTSPSVS